MELRIINTFLHIAELRSFSRAARELGYSQSAVSAQIAQLEAELETPLFDRVGKTVRLTDAGQTFLSYARTLLATSEQAKAAQERYQFRSNRLILEERERQKKLEKKAVEKLSDLATHSHHTDPTVLDKKRKVIEAAIAKSRARQPPG